MQEEMPEKRARDPKNRFLLWPGVHFWRELTPGVRYHVIWADVEQFETEGEDAKTLCEEVESESERAALYDRPAW